MSLALKSSRFMTSVSRPASTSAWFSFRDRARQWPISCWPHSDWSLCRDRMATQRWALGAWEREEREEGEEREEREGQEVWRGEG